MAWKKYFRTANTSGALSPISNNGGQSNTFNYRNFQSNLPEVYIGHPNRIERYNQYEQMDMDSEVNAALDILANSARRAMTKTTAHSSSFGVKVPQTVKSRSSPNS